MFECARLMLPVANFMPRLPGLTALAGSMKTYALSPVWSDSTTADAKFCPMPKTQAVKPWHRARDFERKTRQPGKQDGARDTPSVKSPARHDAEPCRPSLILARVPASTML